jgi:hypothetical protein
MFKKKYFPANHDFKTGFLCKLSIIVGLVFLIIFLTLETTSIFLDDTAEGFLKQIYELSQSTIPESIIALSLILIAIGVILYFLSCQFAKLEKIAKEIENSVEFKEKDD